jgi:hypothetical protein
VGNQLRLFGLTTKRDSQGYALILSPDQRRKIHRLARDYEVAPDEPVATCPQCAEVAA